MADNFQVTIDNCHEEPIHIPGSIQPHGYLLVVDPKTLCVSCVSENISELLGEDFKHCIGKQLKDIVDDDYFFIIKQHWHTSDLQSFNPTAIEIQHQNGTSAKMSAIVTYNGDVILISLEPASQVSDRAYESVLRMLKDSVQSLMSVHKLDSTFQNVVEEVKRFSGFDRVMLYQFDHEYNGEVIAEAKERHLNAFVKQHFPESDIPKQARELYVRNPIRLLCDVDAVVSPLYPSKPHIDLGGCSLRSVSPIHCQYLRNMGVKASMSISIIIKGKLWGLIACHHYSPNFIAFEIREIAQYTSVMLSQLISVRLHEEETRRNAEHLVSLDTLYNAMANKEKFQYALTEQTAALIDLVSATGVAWCIEGEFNTAGAVPEYDAIDLLHDWIKLQLDEEEAYYFTHQVSVEKPDFERLADTASGLLFIPLTPDNNSYVMWFRKEIIQTKNWGGKPEKVIEFTDDGSHRLMPRSSFELWKQNVYKKSAPWKDSEVDSALKLRSMIQSKMIIESEKILKMNSLLEDLVDERTAALNEEIKQRQQAEKSLKIALERSETSNKELERFAFVASHDLQEPLRKIQTFGDRLQRSSQDFTEKNNSYINKMRDAALRMQTLIKNTLSFSRISNDELNMSLFNADDMLETVLSDISVLIQEKGAVINADKIGVIFADQGQIVRVFQNLLQNSLKFVAPERQPVIEIRVTARSDSDITIAFKDNGIGFDKQFADRIFNLFERLHGKSEFEGTGMGLAICKKIVDRHNGSIWAEAIETQGSAFYIKLPLVLSSQ